MLLDAFSQMLRSEFDVVGTAKDGLQLLQLAPALKPDVIVLDIGMPRLSGIEAARELQDRLAGVGFVFLTVSEDPRVAMEALDTLKGASYLIKSSAGTELIEAIQCASQRRTYITPYMAQAILEAARSVSPTLQPTPRQHQVLELLAKGKSMKQVAADLGISARTVAHHKYTMMSSLGIESNAELIRFANRLGLRGC